MSGKNRLVSSRVNFEFILIYLSTSTSQNLLLYLNNNSYIQSTHLKKLTFKKYLRNAPSVRRTLLLCFGRSSNYWIWLQWGPNSFMKGRDLIVQLSRHQRERPLGRCGVLEAVLRHHHQVSSFSLHGTSERRRPYGKKQHQRKGRGERTGSMLSFRPGGSVACRLWIQKVYKRSCSTAILNQMANKHDWDPSPEGLRNVHSVNTVQI